MKRMFRFLFIIIVIGIIAIWSVDKWVSASAKTNMYSSVTNVPAKKVGLLLGTSKYLSDNMVNLYYKYRIDATVALYKAGKIQYVLISGDNSRKEYSEPEMMQADLIAAGIPAERIFLDFAGFRTLDSIVRCKLVFGEDDILIISQPFHNERALFIADKKDIKAVAYNAQDVSANYGFKTQMREKLARIKLLLDIAFDKQPKFLGEQVRIQ